jgi:cytochrome c oxidase cbb3-type subunit 3
MAVEERDPVSGYLTTGHEWNGIKELNTPVPRLVYIALVVTALFALGCWILMPAFPLGSTFTKGLLGADDRAFVTASVREAAAERAAWTNQITAKSYSAIQADPNLMADVRTTGAVLFGDNCAVCHGRDAKGQPHFPNLTTTSWLWGGAPEAIAETIRVGINSPHANTRVSQMPAFGRDNMLKREDMEAAVAYVLSLSGKPPANKAAADKVAASDRIAAGKAVFATNCASCHGPEAKGNPEVGAPNLTDHYWIHGSGEDALYGDVWGGLQGHMPTWEDRLSPLERKILALYIVDLRRPRQ